MHKICTKKSKVHLNRPVQPILVEKIQRDHHLRKLKRTDAEISAEKHNKNPSSNTKLVYTKLEISVLTAWFVYIFFFWVRVFHWTWNSPTRLFCPAVFPRDLPVLASQRHTPLGRPTFLFLFGSWGLNSGPHACKASTLPTEPPLSLWNEMVRTEVIPFGRLNCFVIIDENLVHIP